MAIYTSCPRCGEDYTLRDPLWGKKVRCRECQNPFLVRAEMDEPVEDREDSGVPRPRRRRSKLPVIITTAGLVLVVLLIGCGRQLFGFLQLQRALNAQAQMRAEQAKEQAAWEAVGNQDIRPAQPADAKPMDFNEALAFLSDAHSPRRRDAATWLAREPVNAARRQQVAKALDLLLNDPDRDTRLAALDALKSWGTTDNVPSLIAVIKDDTFNFFLGEPRKKAMSLLGQLKDPRAAAALTHYLPNAFERGNAEDALHDLGPAAESEVVKYLHDPDNGARDAVQRLLTYYRSSDKVYFSQTLSDLGRDPSRRRNAADWLNHARVQDQFRKEVAVALEPLLVDPDWQARDVGTKAMLRWAAVENIPTLKRMLESRKGFERIGIFEVLGTMKDERAAVVLAEYFPDFFDRPHVTKALQAIGSPAQSAVHPHLKHQDWGVRVDACKLLKEIGTSESIAPLRAAWSLARNRNDAFVFQAAQDALRAVLARSGDSAATTGRGKTNKKSGGRPSPRP
jgi:hypothetical protein